MCVCSCVHHVGMLCVYSCVCRVCILMCVSCVYAHVCITCVCSCVYPLCILMCVSCVYAVCILMCASRVYAHVCILSSSTYICSAYLYLLSTTGWRRPIECLVCIGHFPQKSPIISGSCAEKVLQLKAPYGSSPLCGTYICAIVLISVCVYDVCIMCVSCGYDVCVLMFVMCVCSCVYEQI